MASNPKIVQYVEELDLLIIRDGEKLYHIDGNAIAGMFKAYMEGHGIDYDICEGCERKREDNTETPACESCQNQKTCKDAPIPSRYDCLGYKPEAGSMRLINADELIIMQLHDENDRPVGPRFVPAEFIENAPTIEAVPLEDYRSMEQTVHKLTQAIAEAEPKHAYVIVDEDGDMECSNCGSSNCFDDYCGHCGAKLIGTRKDEVEI